MYICKLNKYFLNFNKELIALLLRMGMNPEDINIRNTLQSGDIGYITYMHGVFHMRECGYGLSFESYVAEGLHEFYSRYNPDKECMWVCEDSSLNNKIICSLLLMDRGNGSAQLRYYILESGYRGSGLGKKLMDLFMQFLKEKIISAAICGLLTSLKLRHGFIKNIASL